MKIFHNLYRHRRFLFGSFWAEFRYRYTGTALGIFWFIITPLLEAILYSVIFSNLIGARSNVSRGNSYTAFLLTGLFPWLAFTQLITRGSNVLNSSSLFLRRLAVSTDVFVAREALTALVSISIYVFLLIPINLIFGNSLSWYVLFAPIMGFFLVIMGFAISLTLAHLRVFFPDLGEVLGVLLQLWRWVLPINYSFAIFPENIRSLLKLNPLYYFITSFHDIFIEHKLPSLEAWGNMLFWIFIFGVVGSLVSVRLGDEVKDIL